MPMLQFKIIYKILKLLAAAMETGMLDKRRLSPDYLGASKEMIDSILILLEEDGYIKGLIHTRYMDGERVVDMDNIDITLKGLEYLEDNSMMKKAANLAKGIADTIL